MATTRNRGFTLVEVLVALLVMAVLATLCWRGVDSIARAREANADSMERTLRLNGTLQQWERDLLAMYTQDRPAVPTLSFDGANLRVVRRTDEGVQLIVWMVRGEKLQRWSGPVVTRAADLQDAWLRSQQIAPEVPGLLTMLDRVVSWQVYFYRDNAWTNPQSSANVVAAPTPASGASAPAAQRVVLPTGVRMQLTLQDGVLNKDTLLGPQSP